MFNLVRVWHFLPNFHWAVWLSLPHRTNPKISLLNFGVGTIFKWEWYCSDYLSTAWQFYSNLNLSCWVVLLNYFLKIFGNPSYIFKLSLTSWNEFPKSFWNSAGPADYCLIDYSYPKIISMCSSSILLFLFCYFLLSFLIP